jgi:hypothetical protein
VAVNWRRRVHGTVEGGALTKNPNWAWVLHFGVFGTMGAPIGITKVASMFEGNRTRMRIQRCAARQRASLSNQALRLWCKRQGIIGLARGTWSKGGRGGVPRGCARMLFVSLQKSIGGFDPKKLFSCTQ